MLIVVLACFACCISFNIISLNLECYPYMLLLNNLWNQVSPFGHDTDNGIINCIYIVLRSRHNPRTGHATILIDDWPENFQMAHGINMNDVIYHYEWKCQSAWQLQYRTRLSSPLMRANARPQCQCDRQCDRPEGQCAPRARPRRKIIGEGAHSKWCAHL